MAEVLLTWLVLYASLFAISGFSAIILRAFARTGWSDRAILRACSLVSFGGSLALWLLTVLVAG